ncbi:MAG: helix-turn-helix domain-containing protein [Clostridiales bacterium]|nr:helix-turn-helix domain-containing protein [Clostridiales bacterium]
MIGNVVIAIPDEAQRACIRQSIDWKELEIVCAAEAADSVSLIAAVRKHDPFLIIASSHLGDMPLAECIEYMRRQNMWTACLALGTQENIAEVNDCLELHVDGLLLQPYGAQMLHQCISRIKEKTQNDTTYAAIQRHIRAIRQKFIKYDIWSGTISHNLPKINEIFSTHFHEGLFRVAFLRFDNYSKDGIYGITDIQCQQMIGVTHGVLLPHCFDVICARQITGFKFLVNYSKQNDKQLRKTMEELREGLAHLPSIEGKFSVTLCIGSAVDALTGCKLSNDEADIASWSRTDSSLGKTLYYDKQSDDFPDEIMSKISTLTYETRKAVKALDAEQFEKNVTEFFGLPDSTLKNEKAKIWSDDIFNLFFEVNGELLNSITDATELKSTLTGKLKSSRTTAEFKSDYLESLLKLIDQINNANQLKKSLTVRMAVEYIEENYAQSLDLERVANIVKLSPVYFSYLFKREIGCNFSEFVTQKRIHVAMEMLKKGDKNISEVANSVGYVDQRYFSKKFKQLVGMPPKAYKSSYQ